jgi:hypothetical protein
MLSDTFAGIAPRSAPAFVAAELLGAGLAVGVDRLLRPAASKAAEQGARAAAGDPGPSG